MRLIIFFTLLFFSLSTQAQRKATGAVTYTTAKLSDSMRAQRQRIDNVLWENKQLKQRLDSAYAYYSGDEFLLDTPTRTYSINPDAFMIVKKSDYKPQGKPTATFSNKQSIPGDTIPVPQFSMPYKIETNTLTKEEQDILDLKWQVKFLTQIIDGLYDIIDKQNAKLSLRF